MAFLGTEIFTSMKWLPKAVIIMVVVGSLAGPAKAQNDAGKFATDSTTIKKDGTSGRPSNAVNSTQTPNGRIEHRVSKDEDKIGAVLRTVGNAIKSGAQKTEHAFEQADHWVENKFRAAKRSSKNSSTG